MIIRASRILFLITSSFLLNGMDHPKPTQQIRSVTFEKQSQSDDALLKRKKSKKLIKSVSLPSLDRSKIPQSQHSNLEVKLFDAVRGNNSELLELYTHELTLNINVQDRLLNTVLHHAATNKSEAIINILLNDPRTDGSIKNIYAKAPYELIAIKTNEDTYWYQELFTHCILCCTINLKAKKLKLKYPKNKIPEKVITAKVDRILRKAFADQKKLISHQKHSVHLHFLDRVSKDFVKQMLLSKLTLI